MDIDAYVGRVLDEYRLDDEILRIQNLMVGLTKKPYPDKTVQLRQVHLLTAIFKALLLAKDAREKGIQQVRENNRGSAQDCSAGPAHNAPRRIGVWNVLKQKITGR